MQNFFKAIRTSETLFINEVSQKLENEGKEVFKFGFGQSPFSPPKEVTQTLKDNAHKHEYLAVQGSPKLCEAVANFHSYYDKRSISPENIIIGPGSKILIYNILNSFSKAEVIIPSPSWVSYEPQAKLCGHKVLRTHNKFETRWHTDPREVDQLCKNSSSDIPKILMLTYPGNPTSLSYNKQELEELANIARKNKLLVISDEIYGLINHNGEHVSIANFYPEATIVTSGLSKWCGAGGWRLGIAILPEKIDNKYKDFKEVFLGVNSETFSCANTPIEYAAITAYSNTKATEKYIKHERKILSALGNRCHQILSEGNIRVHAPDGGFYMYLDFNNFKDKLKSKGISTSTKLCQSLIEDAGVVILPGLAFGHSDELLTARYAYVNFDGDQALAASKELGLDQPLGNHFLEKYCPKTLEGTKRLVNWLKQ